MGMISSYLNSFLNTKNVQKPQEANATEGTQRPAFGQVTNPNNVSYKDPIVDSFSVDSKAAGKMLSHIPALYMFGFCLGFAPILTMVATGAFLFANKDNDSFKSKLSETIAQHGDAFKNLTAKYTEDMQKAQAEAQAYQAQKAQGATQGNAAPAPEQAATPEAEQQKEQTPMTPIEKAQARCAKAEDYKAKAEMNLAKKEEAQRVADEKVQLTQAKLDKAQADYDKATAEVKAQMTDRMMHLHETLEARQASASIAKEKTDVARALLSEADVKLQKAQRAFEDLQAEEIVDIG